MSEKIGSAGGRLCEVCAALFCAVIVIQNFRTSLSGHPEVVLLAFAAAGAVLFLCIRFLRPFRGFVPALFVLRFALALFFILFLQPQPVSDFETMYRAAVQLSQGGHAYLDGIYFSNWAYQSGFVAYQALVIKLFGPSLLPLQLLNGVYLSLTNVLVYLIAKRFLSQRAAMTAGVLYALYPAPLFLAGVLTNQHLATLLMYCAVYILLSDRELTPLRTAGAGALIALGNAIRAIGIVPLLACLLWIVLRALHSAKPRALLFALSAAAGYFALSAALSGLIIATGVNPRGLSNNLPMWKFVLGFNEESSGSWNREDYEAHFFFPTQEECDRAMRETVKQRLHMGPVRMVRLAWRKSNMIFGGYEDLNWGFGQHDASRPVLPFLAALTWGRLTDLFMYCDKGVYSLGFCLALAGLVLCLGRPERCGKPLLPVILLCGYYAVHLLIEVQPRYRYFMIPCVYILGGICIDALMARCNGTDHSI